MQIPAIVRNRAVSLGADDWLERLPDIVSSLEDDWSVTLGRTYEGGSDALVAEAARADGTRAVLKVVIPRGEGAASGEATVLRIAEGDGCPRLYEFDGDRGALLMERLGRSMYELGLPLAVRLELLCTTVERIWRPAPESGLPTGAERARRLRDDVVRLWEELDHPCSKESLTYALDAASRRESAHRDDDAVVVHGDVHQLNALQSGNGFKLVDPVGLLAEPEYDLGVLMRGDPIELIAGDPLDRARWLAARTGLDPVAIWEWGVIERMATGLLCTRIGLQPLGRDTLAAVEAVTGLAV